MNRIACWLFGLMIVGVCCTTAFADSRDADRLLKKGFPERDLSRSPIKVLIASENCVIAASAWEFKSDTVATIRDVAFVRVTGTGDREVVEVADGKTATVTFDRPVKKPDDLNTSKIVSIETSTGKVIRLGSK